MPAQEKVANPLLRPWRSNFGIAPFSKIEPRHFRSAFKQRLKEHRDAVSAIARSDAKPTFANTIVALEKAQLPLKSVSATFFNLSSADTNDELQAIECDITPKLAAHHAAIFLNAALFKRIRDLFDRRDDLGLTPEQRRLLERYHVWFVRTGASLKSTEKKRVAAIQKRLAELSTTFNQNVLADEQSWSLELKGEPDLAGLPPAMRSAARRAAIDRGLRDDNVHVITLSRSSVEPFLAFSSRRDLRERAFKAWASRGENGGATDNRAILTEAVKLRAELANLIGYDTYAEFALDDRMAGTPDAVRDLLNEVWVPARRRAAEELEALSARAQAEGANYKIKAWDWRYFSEKERKARFDIDDGEVRPYLQLDAIIKAAFDTATKLFGLTFKERKDIKAYHPDVRVFEVSDANGAHVALFLGDYFARPSKRSGAWMSSFRSQHKLTRSVQPIVINVLNFARGGGDEPTLISFDDARTLFHEFGHGLHGMLSDVTYPSLAGTSVSSDFVELPSQLYEHWLTQPQVLKEFARHYKTGKPIPQSLLKRIKAAENFNRGFTTVEYTSSAIVDLELHSNTADKEIEPEKFEAKVLKQIGMPREIIMRHRLPHFMHIMIGYQSGYYSYLWSEVMDADAFEAFKETGDIFDQKTAARLKKHIYSAGNRADPQEAYEAFRGRPPKISALLKQRGFD